MTMKQASPTFLHSFMDSQLYVPALVTAVLLVLSTLLFFLYRQFRARGDTVLFVGLAGSGKTTIFTKLINPENRWVSYTSVKENLFTNYMNRSGKPVKLLDFPGSESFRKILFQKWLNQERKTLKCVCFVVDSAGFSKKDVAEFLYDILYELQGKLPVLVACNKQDIGHAKSGQLIQKSTEQEFGLINISREAALSSTDGRDEKRLLAPTGRDFKWSDLRGPAVDFVECSAEEGQQQEFTLAPIREWIDGI